MERGTMENLKFDKRLRKRRDWISPSDAEEYDAALPDVSERRWVEDQADGPSAQAAPASGTPDSANPTGVPGEDPPRRDES
jgi:hypothetical protein